MKTITETMARVKSNPFYAKHKIPEKLIDKIVHDYQESLIETLVENGHVYITEDLRLDVVSIQSRRYVLRGIEYSSSRLYKLKSTIGAPIYDKISEIYSMMRGDE